jgi:hypothetical protein
MSRAATSASASANGAPKHEQARQQLTTATTMSREMDMRFWWKQGEPEVKVATDQGIRGR